MNCVSYSLFGPDKRYRDGVIPSIQDAARFYPGYEIKIYVDPKTIPAGLIQRAQDAGATIIRGDPAMVTHKHWRLLAMDAPGAEAVLFRDLDSRITEREAEAVYAWLASPWAAHVMRDYPHHTASIMAGMWGIKKPEFPELSFQKLWDWYVENVSDWEQTSDQVFLDRMIWHRIRHDVMQHDEITERQDTRTFPTPRSPAGEFVGEVIWDGSPVAKHREFGRNYTKCRQH
jgi:hypothetical protein